MRRMCLALVLVARLGRLLQDVDHTAQAVCGGERQVLAAEPVLQAHAARRVQGALRKLDHHQSSLQVQPVLQGGFSLARGGPRYGARGAAAQGLEQVFPGPPEEALEAEIGRAHV